MIHSVNLSREAREIIGQLTINLILLTDKTHLATDIRTGFPTLMSHDRLMLDRYLNRQLIHFKAVQSQPVKRPLRFIDDFLIQVEPELCKMIETLNGIELDSLSVDVFVDAYLPQKNPQLNSSNNSQKDIDLS